MSVIKPDSEIYGEELREAECFYCYKRVWPLAVLWSSNGYHLWMHAKCVKSLAVRMFRDVHEVECMPKRLFWDKIGRSYYGGEYASRGIEEPDR